MGALKPSITAHDNRITTPLPSASLQRSARLRLLWVLSLVAALSIGWVFSLVVLAKSARLHELNAAHLQHSFQLHRLVAGGMQSREQVEEFKRTVSDIMAQPQACLDTAGPWVRQFMRWIGTYEAIRICEDDLRLGQQTQILLSRVQQGELPLITGREGVYDANIRFAEHSEAFAIPIAKTVLWARRAAFIGAGVLIALVVPLLIALTRSVLASISRLQTANEQLTASEHECRHLAYYDQLTEVPNRTAFQQELAHQIRWADENGGSVLLLFVDLDRFKDVNDTLDHSHGDQILQQIARRLAGCVPKPTWLSRLGGDEFNILWATREEPQAAARILASKILFTVAKPLRQGHADLYLTASIGIASYPQNTNNVNNLFRLADIAMYAAKALGGNNCQLFSESMDQDLRRRMQLERDLRYALKKNKFDLHYQPIVQNGTGQVVGAEALLRWQHPSGEWISPVEFIPVAESAGLIQPIGRWVLDEACRQLAHWRTHNNSKFTLSINVSVLELKADQFVQHVQSTLARYELTPDALSIEVTESHRIDEPRVRACLDQLHSMGIKLLLDDFGTGYSAFSYLETLPFDLLKIDRSFVKNMPTGKGRNNVAASIIAMAHELGLGVVAEGVEDLVTLHQLRSYGCDFFQGYYLGRPKPVADFCFHPLPDTGASTTKARL